MTILYHLFVDAWTISALQLARVLTGITAWLLDRIDQELNPGRTDMERNQALCRMAQKKWCQ